MSEPVAWMRRKETEVPGTLRTYHSITSHKILPDDIPLYASSYAQGVADAARIVEDMDIEGAYTIGSTIRALSSPPSVTLATENGIKCCGYPELCTNEHCNTLLRQRVDAYRARADQRGPADIGETGCAHGLTPDNHADAAGDQSGPHQTEGGKS